MKKVLIAIGILASSVVFGQSNTKGTIGVGLGWGVQLGGATIKNSGAYESSEKGIGARSNYGLRASYGIANAFSLGVFVRSESAAYVTTTTTSSNDIYSASASSTIYTRGLGFGLEPKLFFLNKDKFNMYVAVPVGLSSGKGWNSTNTTDKISMSGLNYGVNWGFNWYWASFIGMSLDLGYAGVGLKGEDNGITTNVNGGGVYFGLGLITKFGGE